MDIRPLRFGWAQSGVYRWDLGLDIGERFSEAQALFQVMDFGNLWAIYGDYFWKYRKMVFGWTIHGGTSTVL